MSLRQTALTALLIALSAFAGGSATTYILLGGQAQADQNAVETTAIRVVDTTGRLRVLISSGVLTVESDSIKVTDDGGGERYVRGTSTRPAHAGITVFDVDGRVIWQMPQYRPGMFVN